MSRFIVSPTSKIGFGFACLLLIFLLLVGFRYDSLPYNPGAEFSDSTISRWPDALHFQRSLRDHHTLPLWNSHLMAGQPFAANPGTKVWYPLTWFLLLWDAAFQINLMTAVHLWLGGMGMWAWARCTGLEIWPAALAAVSYLLAPKLLAHAGAGHLDLLIAVGWLPWLLYFLHRLAGRSSSPFDIAALAFVGAMIFIGALQLSLFTFGLGFAYAVYLLAKTPEKPRFLNNLLMAVVLGVGFAAVQWIPLVELNQSISRGDIREEDAALFSLKAGQFLGLLLGDHSGSVETLTYTGVSVFVLALVGLFLQPRQNRFWWGVILLSALYSLGDHFFLWPILIKILPPLRLFRVPSRAWFLVALAMPYLAGWGMQFLVKNPPQSPRVRLGIVAVIGLGLTCSFASLVMMSEFVKVSAILGTFALPATAIVIALLIFDRVSPNVLVLLMMVVAAADCLWIGQAVLEGRPRKEWLSEEPPVLLENLTGRIYTPSYAIPQQDTAYWQIQRFDGVDPFQLRNFVENSDSATGVLRKGYSTTIPAEVVLEPAEDNIAVQNAPMDAKLLAQWGVQWVITNYPVTISGLEFAAQDRGMYFYKNTFDWGITMKWDGPNRVMISVENPEANPFTITNAAGWQRENGEKIDQNSLSLPAENAVFVYRPRGVYVGLIVSAVSYGLTLLWLLVSGFLPSLSQR